MRKLLTKFIYAITIPITTFAIILDESKRLNEDGSWNKYWARKNKKGGN